MKPHKPKIPILDHLLPGFPRPLPDELLFSTLCRLSEQVDFNHVRFIKLLGLYEDHNSPRAFNPLFPVPTAIITQLAPKDLITEDEIIANHTLLPFLKPLVLPEYYEDQLNRTKYGTLSSTSTYAALPALQVCPACLEEDARGPGLPYIRRSHQIPGVLVCLQHRCWLKAVPSPYGTDYRYFNPSQLLDLPAETGGPIPDSVITLAQDLLAVPKTFQHLDANEIWQVLRWNLGRVEILGEPSQSRWKTKHGGSFIPQKSKDTFLRFVDPFKDVLDLNRENLRTIRTPHRLRRLTTPALALLCLRYCKLEPAEFAHKLQKEELPSSFTRRCLNNQCTSFQKHVIPDSRNRLPGTGNYIFRCPTCQFAYLIPKHSINRDSRRAPVYSLGQKQDEQFRELWSDLNIPFCKILRTFGLTHFTMFNLALYRGLPMDRNGLALKSHIYRTAINRIREKEEHLDRAKKIMLDAARQHPQLSFRQLRVNTNREIKAAATHIDTFDPDWIREHFGTRTKSGKPRQQVKTGNGVVKS